MLQELIIDNLALLKHIHISFDSGMTCLTGETGAGKSIMLDAIQLALGGKCIPSLVTNTDKNTEITAVFTAEVDSHAHNWLLANDFPITTTKNSTIEVVLYRSISLSANGSLKSKSSINKKSASLFELKQLGQYLIYIHGQHEHLNLLKEQNQLKILDGYGGLNKLSLEVHTIYKNWANLKQQLQTALKNQTEFQAKKQLLEFQVAELHAAEIKPNEWQEINNQHQWLANQQQHLEQLNQVNFILDEGADHQPSVNQMLSQVTNILGNIAANNSTVENINELINQALININEASDELTRFINNLDNDPETLHTLDKRISVLYELARKYKTKPEKLNELLEQYEVELATLGSLDQQITDLTQQIQQLETSYYTQASLLSTGRADAAHNLSTELTSLLKKLRMDHAELLIHLQPNATSEPKANGLEQCTFLIKTNLDQPLQALAIATSGGELSRVALATQVATAQVEGTPSLIFDEVDVGIGGGTAEIVGKLLHKIGVSTQVMCITHLAQVAAQADQHITVSKTLIDGKTNTVIALLNEAERIQELARMIGGLTITEQTLAHARELLVNAKELEVALYQD